ncbi:MAG: SBBP repeat-containing protein [Ignavibacteria bacterium]
MKKIVIVFALFITIYSTPMNAQVTQEWVATYSGTGSGYNFPKKSAIDKFGNFIVAGNSDSTDDYDYIILKYSPYGNLIWKQRYNGTANSYDYLIGMVLDDSNNVYVTGGSDEGILNGSVNWVTIKYNSEGIMKWKKSLNWIYGGVDEPFGMAIDKNRNIYVTGYGKVTNAERAMVTIKYDSNGDSLWTKNYVSLPQRSNWGYSVVADDFLNVYSSGYGAVPTGNEIISIKYDAAGNEKWVKKWPTNSGDYLRPTFSAVDKENNLIVVGYSYFSNSYDIVTLKYTANGDTLWSRIYNGGNTDRANSLFLDEDSDILIAGYTDTDTYGDYLILKYASNGDTLLLKKINGEDPGSSDEAFAIISDSLKNIYVTGYSQSMSFNYDYLTLKLSKEGNSLWSKVYRTSHDNFSYCLNLDHSKSIYISGEAEQNGGNTAIASVKYSQMTGMLYAKDEVIENFELSNYPNPFNPNTLISFRILSNSLIKLRISDVLGREVETLMDEYKLKGEYKINFNSYNYPSGIYFYSLFSNGTIVKTNRMLIIK